MKKKNKKHNTVEVESEKRLAIAQSFFQNAITTYRAANHLIDPHLQFVNQAAILAHLSMEYLLKGCCVWDKLKYELTHDLSSLCSEVPFFKKLYRNNRKLFEEVDAFFHYRYLMMDETSREKIQCKYDTIELSVTGIPVCADELGTDSFDRLAKLWAAIIEAMPDELYTVYEEIESQLPAME